jgi:hypothetical protein
MSLMRHEIRLNAIDARLADHERRLVVAETAIPPKANTTPSQRQIARDFLKEKLREAPRMALEILGEAGEAGISERTLRRAARDVGVVAYRGHGPAADRKSWAWRIPRGLSAEPTR